MIPSPVKDSEFIGRTEIIEILVKRVNSFDKGYRQNVALIGPKNIGKTSIALQFCQQYALTNTIFIYINLEVQDFGLFLTQFSRSLIQQYLFKKGLPHQYKSYSDLMDGAKRYIPKTISKIDDIQRKYEKKQFDSAYSELMDLTTFLYDEAGMKAVVILDEFHRLSDFPIKSAFQQFGKSIMLQKNTLYFIISSALSHSQEILASKLSLLFGNFEKIIAKPFEFETANAFISEKIQPAELSAECRAYLIYFTDGHPYYLNAICNKLRSITIDRAITHVDENLLLYALRALLFDCEGSLNAHFQSMLSRWLDVRTKGNHLTILVSISNGVNKLRDIASKIRRSLKETSSQLNDLVEAELISKSGVFYFLPNKVLAFWLTAVYQNRELSSQIDKREQSNSFFGEGKSDLIAFLSAHRKNNFERIKNLLCQFSNDKVVLGGKSKILPKFKDIETVDSIAGNCVILARSVKVKWYCRVYEGNVSESIVFDAVSQMRSKKYRNFKRVLICLGGLDQNAKLLAKNNNVWVLSLKKINVLMDYYRQGKLIPHYEEPNKIQHLQLKSQLIG